MNDYSAVFMALNEGMPIAQGNIGFKSACSVEHLKNDEKSLSFILDNINKSILDNMLDNMEFPIDQIVVIIPELID